MGAMCKRWSDGGVTRLKGGVRFYRWKANFLGGRGYLYIWIYGYLLPNIKPGLRWRKPGFIKLIC